MHAILTRFLPDFEWILELFFDHFESILVSKNRVGKQVDKKMVWRAASAGDADPMERIFGEAEW